MAAFQIYLDYQSVVDDVCSLWGFQGLPKLKLHLSSQKESQMGQVKTQITIWGRKTVVPPYHPFYFRMFHAISPPILGQHRRRVCLIRWLRSSAEL